MVSIQALQKIAQQQERLYLAGCDLLGAVNDEADSDDTHLLESLTGLVVMLRHASQEARETLAWAKAQEEE